MFDMRDGPNALIIWPENLNFFISRQKSNIFARITTAQHGIFSSPASDQFFYTKFQTVT
jgi:hypothetical protein